MKLSILSISNSPLERSQGSGYVILNFCNQLRILGHKVKLIGPDAYEPFQFLKGRLRNFRLCVGTLLFILMKIRKKDYNVIEFYGGQSWLSILFLRMRNRPYIIIHHTNGPETRYNQYMIKYGFQNRLSILIQQIHSFLFWKSFLCADGIVTVSKDDRIYLLSEGIAPNKVKAINNSLPDIFINLDISIERKKTIGFCGTWIPKKGIEVLVTDLSRILFENQNYKLVLIGVGRKFVKEYYFTKEICQQIEVIPFVHSKLELINHYKEIEIFVLPSIIESFGLVAAEAMACGCALVATPVGLAADLKDHQEAIIIEKPSSPLLYKALKKLIYNETLRKNISLNGYKKVQEFRWDSAGAKLENIYQNWLRQHMGGSDSC